MKAQVIIPLAAIGVAGLYIFMKYKAEAEAQRVIIEGIRAGTITQKDIVSVTDTETTFMVGGKPYTFNNKVLGKVASAAGQGIVNLFTSWFGKDKGPAKYTGENSEIEPVAGYQFGDATRAARHYALGRGFFKPTSSQPMPWGGPRALCIVDQ